MTDDSMKQTVATIYTYDIKGELTSVTSCSGEAARLAELAAGDGRLAPAFAFEHDAPKGVFRLTWADGTVEVFRDKPARHLVVEPDPETGQMKPVVKRGTPTYLHLCREEREIR